MLAVAGGSSSGKTTLARRLHDALPTGSVSLLSQDSYYADRSELAPEARECLNFDHPDALDSLLFAAHIRLLREGKAIDVPQYDFATHRRLPSTFGLPSRPILIVEGRLVLHDAGPRHLFDLTLFVDVDADLRLLRRLQRDVAERGRTIEQIARQHTHSVRDMHNRYVEPTKAFADLVVPTGAENPAVLDLLLCKLRSLALPTARAAAP
jgi:uridine kinase